MTILFDALHSYGMKSTERRAHKARPDLAERDRARRVKPGFVLGTQGPGGLQGLFDDMTLEHEYRPRWYRVVLHIHWWMQQHGPRTTWRHLKAFWQRGRRGWADSDTWSFHVYIAGIIRDAVQHLNDNKHGWPGGPMTFEEWGEILSQISEGMDAATKDGISAPVHVQLARQAQMDLAFDHLKKYFGHLWD